MMGGKRRTVPTDFVDNCHLTIREMRKKYHAGTKTINAWRNQYRDYVCTDRRYPTRPCAKCDPETGEEIERYSSVYQAALSNGCSNSGILLVMNKRGRTACGFEWKDVRA